MTGFYDNWEANEPIRLDDNSSVLLENVLDFQYTGEYTVGSPEPTPNSRQADGDERSRSDGDAESAREPPIKLQSDQLVNASLTPETGEAVTGIDLPPPEIVLVELANACLNSENPALINQTPEKDLSNAWGVGEPIADTLFDNHPCYFHLRMYGEADYFMIDGLILKRARNFAHLSWIMVTGNSLWR
ncbi:hypothetical protein N7486_005031 [Penicillium sp. IBT 16267x]|nr:hypothetical protein N7486_005031 [Penicillium sp. IBT 16267x]